MPLTIVRQDITKMKVDAIVNAANPELQMGGGVCGAIFRAAGTKRMQAACDKVAPIRVGGAAITRGFDLPARYVIHAAGPVYDGRNRERSRELLRSAYIAAMKLAEKKRCRSIAFPLISSGTYGYPKGEALEVARLAIEEFLRDHDLDVRLVVFDQSSFLLSGALLGKVESYIDQHYVDDRLRDAEVSQPLIGNRPLGRDEPEFSDTQPMAHLPYMAPTSAQDEAFFRASMEDTGALTPLPPSAELPPPKRREEPFTGVAVPRPKARPSLKPMLPKPARSRRRDGPFVGDAAPLPASSPSMRPAPARHKGLEELIGNLDEPFSQALLRLIDAKGRTDAEVYKRANIDRKLFSKIRNGRGYTPRKPTILALAIALELTLPEVEELLGRAGYALSHASKFDVIVEYFIVSGNYDIFQLNEVLFSYDQPLLGG